MNEVGNATKSFLIFGLGVGFLYLLWSMLSYQPSPVYSVTKNLDHLRPLLFTPDDLDEGWVLNTYKETVNYGLSSSAEDVIWVSMAAEPIRYNRRFGTAITETPYKVIHSAEFYTDTVTASDTFKRRKDFLQEFYGELPVSVNFQPRIDNFVIGCTPQHDSKMGAYLSCNFLAQRGRYKSHVSMNVDGDLITLQDWEDVINVVQDKLINHVE